MNNLWEYKKIGDVCIVERGGSPRPIDKYITGDKNGINWIKIGDTTDSMYITETAQKIIPEGMKKSRYVKPGDFLLSNSMSFGRPYILKIDGCIHDGWLVLRDEKGVFDKRFLYYYLSSKVTYKKFEAMAVGGVVNNLNKEMVRNVEVPIPNKNEQSNIANLLDKLNRILDNRKEELQQLDNLIKARFVEMFGECNNYELLGKADIFISDGNYSSKYPTADEFVTEGIPFIRASNMIDNTITDDEMYYISEEKHAELLKGHVKPNDVLIATRGAGIGKIAVVPEKHNDSNINAQIVLLRCNKDIYNPLYLSWYMKLQETQIKIQGLISGSAQPQLPIKRLIQLTLLKPEIEMQNEFADFVHQVDKSKFIDIINQLKKLLSLKRGMYYGN